MRIAEQLILFVICDVFPPRSINQLIKQAINRSSILVSSSGEPYPRSVRPTTNKDLAISDQSTRIAYAAQPIDLISSSAPSPAGHRRGRLEFFATE